MKKFKKLSTIFAILMILTFTTSILAVQNANAQTWTKVTAWPFVDAIPHTAGVGQPVLINWGLLNFLNTYSDGWNVTLQITDPNGKATNYTGKTWSTGTVGRKMSFSEPGNYTLQCLYNGEKYSYYTGSGNNIIWYYKDVQPAESEIVILEIIEGYWKPDYPGHSLPTEYWARPVDAQLREWYTIMGSWVTTPTNFYAPYNGAPESAHVLWSMPVGDTMQGLSGGDTGSVAFQNGDAYEGKFSGSVILAGVLYYNRYVSGSPQQTIVAVDMHTGKTLWERSYSFGGGRINRGQVFNFITENNRGTWAYLWLSGTVQGQGTVMYALDAYTGDLKFNMTDVPGGTIVIGENGEMLKYSIANIGNAANPNYRLLRWNSTYVVNRSAGPGTSDAWGSQIQGRQFDASLGYDVNVSMPSITSSIGSYLTAFPEDRIIYGNQSAAGITLTGVSLEPDTLGQVIFLRRSWQAPPIWEDLTLTTQSRWAAFSDDPYVAIWWTKENRVNYAFSLETGKYLWESESHGYQDAWTNAGMQGAIVDGKLYEASISGVIYCYDAATGDVVWTYENMDKHNESYHGENWWSYIMFISDGKIYIGHLVHSPQVPTPRGAPFLALDCETGGLVWEIDGAFRQTLWGGRALIGDSIITTMDTYDQQIYAIGKGPSEMTISAPNVAIPTNTKALITGTIIDISPGTQNDQVQFRFPKGVPAVSDESQSEWMLHVYKHFERPENTEGVEIVVYAKSATTGEEINIGTTTSNANGVYSITWTPPSEDDWEIYAYFSGSASYYGSSAQTSMAVSAAPEVVLPEPVPPYGWYIAGAAIAIIVAIAIVGLVLYKKISNNQH